MKSISCNTSYPNICLQASEDDAVFNIFKTLPQYKDILEHTSPQMGIEYLSIIERDNPILLDYGNIEKFKENDIYGGSDKWMYSDILISPSTLRYIKVLSDLIKIFGNLNGFKIAEIGGGYGGQCKIINDYFNIKNYHIIDLPEVNLLSKKYLQKLNINNVRFSTSKNLIPEDYDLVISNYAYTELDRELQDIYKLNIIDNSKNGYLTCNFISNLFIDNSDFYSREELINLKEKVEIFKEEPLSHSNNFLLTWRNS
jgi:hypothetical protein